MRMHRVTTSRITTSRITTSMATLSLLLLLVLPGVALAQDEEEVAAESADEQIVEEAPPYADPDAGWNDRRFHVGGFYGNMSGATALGLIENVFFRTQFNMGSGAAGGVRGGWAFASRFDVELEYGRTSPGLLASLTDLRGRGKTEVPFSDLDMTWLTASVNYSMVERTRRIVPYLTIGVGVVSVSSAQEDIVKARKPGVVFGGGVRVRIIDMLALRVDARGLRSGFGTKQEEGDLPGVFVGDFTASHFVWTAGLEIHF